MNNRKVIHRIFKLIVVDIKNIFMCVTLLFTYGINFAQSVVNLAGESAVYLLDLLSVLYPICIFCYF